MNTNHTFSEALNWMLINNGTISLTLNNVKRIYYKDEDNDIICIPNENKNSAYRVTQFMIDAVLSNEWQLYEINQE